MRRTTLPSEVPFGDEDDDDGIPPEEVYWDPDEWMPPQAAGWTCSACSLAWVLRATGLDPNMDEWGAVTLIGYPEQINPQVGLTNINGPGAALIGAYSQYGQAAVQAWLGFDEVYAAAQRTTGQMSGTNWYHWVSLRGISGPDLWIANSAEGYKGVGSILSRADFNRLGPMSVVLLE